MGWDAFVFGITLPALVTAILTLLLIMGIARLRGRHSTQTLLLTGIALNFFISAVITLLMVVNQQEIHKIFFWTMGSVATVSWRDIACLLPVMAIVITILYRYAKELNILQLGTESAQSLGVNAQRTTHITLIASSLLIGVVVSFCGVIGFIGLIVPHIARLIFGSDNRHLFTYSLFFGALFRLVADTLARTLAAPAELPVGSITALAGAPYFISLLLRKRQRKPFPTTYSSSCARCPRSRASIASLTPTAPSSMSARPNGSSGASPPTSTRSMNPRTSGCWSPKSVISRPPWWTTSGRPSFWRTV